MRYRRLGRTGHQSSEAILGGAAFWVSEPEVVEEAFARAVGAGVNHLDIAPSYGHAETVAGPMLERYRDHMFVACKTQERSASGARRELERSLELLRVGQLDLYQLHAVTSDEELDAILAPGGAAETLVAAKDEGLVAEIGLTGHFDKVPGLFLRALERLDLGTVMLPVNPPMLALPHYRADLEQVFEVAAARDIGVMAIKAVARRLWQGDQHAYQTWYEPWDDEEQITKALAFALSFPITGFAMPGDVRLHDAVLRIAAEVEPMSPAEAAAAIGAASPGDALVPR